MNDQHATGMEIRRCARCRGTYVPFPVKASRLCAPCVYRVVTGWPTEAEIAGTAREMRELITIVRRMVAPGYPHLAFAPMRRRGGRRGRRSGRRVGAGA